MEAWQLAIYGQLFNATFGSYRLHYQAAVAHHRRGMEAEKSVSISRMEELVTQMVVYRMKGGMQDAPPAVKEKVNGKVDESLRW